MNFTEISIAKIDNGWLVRYGHIITRMEQNKGPVDQIITGAVAMNTLEMACKWITDNQTKAGTPVEVKP
jgi:hypothetical protein